MKRFLVCILFALLLPLAGVFKVHDSFYVAVVFQDHSCYHQIMTIYEVLPLLDDFSTDSSIESVFISRDIDTLYVQ